MTKFLVKEMFVCEEDCRRVLNKTMMNQFLNHISRPNKMIDDSEETQQLHVQEGKTRLNCVS
jgi:hypothetical protein